MSCLNCTTTPDIPKGVRDVYISASHEYILEKVANLIHKKDAKINCDYIFLSIDMDEFFTGYNLNQLTKVEKENINILVLPKGTSPGFNHFSLTKTLDAWLSIYESIELFWILESGSISTFFQPILYTDTKEIFAYECLSRGVAKDGTYMNPGRMFDLAKKTGMLFNLDRQCREMSIKSSAIKKIDKNIFINFIPTAIYNPEFCLRDTVKWTKQLEFNPKSITFEVVETEQVKDMNHLKTILKYYKEKGYNVALDDVG